MDCESVHSTWENSIILATSLLDGDTWITVDILKTLSTQLRIVISSTALKPSSQEYVCIELRTQGSVVIGSSQNFLTSLTCPFSSKSLCTQSWILVPRWNGTAPLSLDSHLLLLSLNKGQVNKVCWAAAPSIMEFMVNVHGWSIYKEEMSHWTPTFCKPAF